MEFFAFLAASSVFGMPWVVWWVSSRRNHQLALKKLDVERERELTRRRHMELEFDLRQRQLTERLFDLTAAEHNGGQAARPQPPHPAPRQMPPTDPYAPYHEQLPPA